MLVFKWRYDIDPYWLEHAKKLDEGKKTYIDHTCGGGKTLVVSCNDKGWSCYCFRCGCNEFVKFGLRPLADLGIIRKAEQALYKSDIVLPADFTNHVPAEYATWFSKAGIFSTTAKRYNFGWSDESKRIILPVYRDNELIFLQARAVEKWRKPKYINVASIPKSSVLFRSIHDPAYDERICYVTEDIASAVRVGMFVPTLSTLGTSASPAQLAQLAKYATVVVWYDSDDAGVNGCIKLCRGLRMLGVNCYSICTDKDPKLLSNRQITEVLTTGELSGRNRPNYPSYYEGKGSFREDVYESTIGMFR